MCAKCTTSLFGDPPLPQNHNLPDTSSIARSLPRLCQLRTDHRREPRHCSVQVSALLDCSRKSVWLEHCRQCPHCTGGIPPEVGHWLVSTYPWLFFDSLLKIWKSINFFRFRFSHFWLLNSAEVIKLFIVQFNSLAVTGFIMYTNQKFTRTHVGKIS